MPITLDRMCKAKILPHRCLDGDPILMRECAHHGVSFTMRRYSTSHSVERVHSVGVCRAMLGRWSPRKGCNNVSTCISGPVGLQRKRSLSTPDTSNDRLDTSFPLPFFLYMIASIFISNITGLVLAKYSLSSIASTHFAKSGYFSFHPGLTPTKSI